MSHSSRHSRTTAVSGDSPGSGLPPAGAEQLADGVRQFLDFRVHPADAGRRVLLGGVHLPVLKNGRDFIGRQLDQQVEQRCHGLGGGGAPHPFRDSAVAGLGKDCQFLLGQAFALRDL